MLTTRSVKNEERAVQLPPTAAGMVWLNFFSVSQSSVSFMLTAH